MTSIGLVQYRPALMGWAGLVWGEVAGQVAVAAVVLAFLCALMFAFHWFSYSEFSTRGGELGFPGRLLLKPLSTAQLAAVPMLLGGGTMVAVFLVWAELVLRHLDLPFALNLPWLSVTLLSFTWWLQAAYWSFPQRPRTQATAALLAAGINLLLGFMPLPLGWKLGTLVVLLIGAAGLAMRGSAGPAAATLRATQAVSQTTAYLETPGRASESSPRR